MDTRLVRDWIKHVLYRRKLARSGVLVGHNVDLLSVGGLKFGKLVEIHNNSCIAANTIEFDVKEFSPPYGSITFGDRCSIGRNAIIATYGGNITIGDDVSINPGCIIYGHGNLTIGNATRIAAQTVIVPANHNFADPSKRILDLPLTRKGVTIGSDVWIGTGARILDGVEIGDRAVIAAGAVVVRSVGKGEIVGGIPARVLKQRFEGPQAESNT